MNLAVRARNLRCSIVARSWLSMNVRGVGVEDIVETTTQELKQKDIDGISQNESAHWNLRPDFTLDSDLQQQLEKNPANHRGMCRLPPVRMPMNFDQAASTYLSGIYPCKNSER